jgi:hypothetical protein
MANQRWFLNKILLPIAITIDVLAFIGVLFAIYGLSPF